MLLNNHASTENLSEQTGVANPTILPLEVIDKAIGSTVRVLLTNDKEFVGKLVGFDDFVNVVLENVSEHCNNKPSDKIIKKMLLNGTQIAMLCPFA